MALYARTTPLAGFVPQKRSPLNQPTDSQYFMYIYNYITRLIVMIGFMVTLPTVIPTSSLAAWTIIPLPI